MTLNDATRAKIKRFAPAVITTASVITTLVVVRHYKDLSSLVNNNTCLVLSPEAIEKLTTSGGAWLFDGKKNSFFVMLAPRP